MRFPTRNCLYRLIFLNNGCYSHSDSSDEEVPESEDGQTEYENKYPLENLYKDEEERERFTVPFLSLSSVELIVYA